MAVFFIRGARIKAKVKDPILQRHALAANTSFIARQMCKALDIRIKVNNSQNLAALSRENHLIVANHVSYTDIAVLSSLYPFVFITSLEMSELPVLGDITRVGGSLFTNRQKYTSLPQEINAAEAFIDSRSAADLCS
jgi:1-acyl-sn-glycerol-3-phosphate acyltransferase